MAICCSDVETLVQTYLDGELAENDAVEFDQHIGECSACRARVAEERRFLAALRARLAAPPAPDVVRRRVLAALDDEDRVRGRARRQRRASWILPGAASLAAAAALLVFALDPWAGQPQAADNPVSAEAVRQHIRRPPIEVQGAGVTPWIKEHFTPRVDPPRFSAHGIDLVGARLSHLRGRDAAQLFYEVARDGRRFEVQVHILDASDLDLHGEDRQVIRGRELWIDERFGHSIVTYKDREGIGYVFTSADMTRPELVDLVVGSDLLLRVSERLRGE